PLTPIEPSRHSIGILGCVALLLFVLAGVRVYIAAAIVGLIRIVSIIGWEARAGIVGTLPPRRAAAVHPDRLPRLPRGHDADAVRGLQEMARLAARRPGGVHHLRGRG